MIRTVRTAAEKYGLFRQGDRIVAALSGGADSVCLLLCLQALREDMGLSLKAVHVHHGLRGAEADRDAEFCRALCEKLAVPFVLRHIDAAALARAGRQSVEEAARDARYRILRQEADGGLIAVAHHRDDQCETVLHNIIRGTGISGLRGMARKNGDIIRPLLDVSRAEIEDFLAARQQDYCVDSTNGEAIYTRNRIRNLLLPYIEENINPGVRDHLISLSMQARELLETPELAAEKLALKQDMERLAGTRKDIAAVHINSAYGLLEKPVGSRVSLPYSMEAVRTYEGVRVEKRTVGEAPLPELPRIEDTCRIFNREADMKIPEKEYTKWFDYDKIKDTVCWRFRRTGDYLVLRGAGRKTVKDYMIDVKLPAGERNRLPLLAAGSHILWIPGYRISEAYKVTDETAVILEVKLNWGEGAEHE